jgi:methionine-rich copper-binding protein CopC
MRAKAFLAIASVVCSMFVFVSAAWAHPAVTKISISSSSTLTNVSGRVFSRKTACVSGRHVILFKQKGPKVDPTTDQQVGTATTTKQKKHGVWSMTVSLHPGTYYAEVTKSSGCRAGLSSSIRLSKSH